MRRSAKKAPARRPLLLLRPARSVTGRILHAGDHAFMQLAAKSKPGPSCRSGMILAQRLLSALDLALTLGCC